MTSEEHDQRGQHTSASLAADHDLASRGSAAEVPTASARKRGSAPQSREKPLASFYSKALKKAFTGGAEVPAKDRLARNAGSLIQGRFLRAIKRSLSSQSNNVLRFRAFFVLIQLIFDGFAFVQRFEAIGLNN